MRTVSRWAAGKERGSVKKFLKLLRNLLIILFVAGLCTVGVLVFQGYQLYRDAVEKTPLEARVAEVRSQADCTAFSELPKTYRDAVVAVEDHRFYEHGGVDPISIARAVWIDLCTMSFAEGGSTITQQVAKNLYFTQEKKLTRKIAEVFVAWDLEKLCEKDEILELYVNSIYFGNGCYTVKAASLSYFGKEPAAMTDYESTLLAGIPNAPSVYDLTENPDLAAQRQRQVVAMMVEHEYLNPQEAAAIFK